MPGVVSLEEGLLVRESGAGVLCQVEVHEAKLVKRAASFGLLPDGYPEDAPLHYAGGSVRHHLTREGEIGAPVHPVVANLLSGNITR